MQFAAAILLTLGLIASPIGCLIQPCDLGQTAHDCCHRTVTPTVCPYDILASAKAAPAQQIAGVVAVAETLFPIESQPFQPVASILTDQSGLHLENRVLRL